MGTVAEHWKRSQDVADATRTLAVTLNSGAVGLLFSVAGWLTGKNIPANWALFPAALFILGLFFVGLSLLVAKDRELARFQVARKGGDANALDFPWYKKSFTWDLVAFLFFVFGAAAAIYSLGGVTAAHG